MEQAWWERQLATPGYPLIAKRIPVDPGKVSAAVRRLHLAVDGDDPTDCFGALAAWEHLHLITARTVIRTEQLMDAWDLTGEQLTYWLTMLNDAGLVDCRVNRCVDGLWPGAELYPWSRTRVPVIYLT